MAVPLPNQIPHPKKSSLQAPSEASVSSRPARQGVSRSLSPARRTSPETLSQRDDLVSTGPGPRKSSPKKTLSNVNSTKADAHTIRERTAEDKTLDPYICACGESFVSENDSYRHVKAHKPVFVRPDHLNDRPLRGHEGLQALKQSLEGERKRPQNNNRQPRRAK